MRREFSAGGLVRKDNLWLIRRPTPNPEYRGNLGWSWPKGWVDEGENLEQAAIREVREEGGVVAKIVKKLPALKVFFKDKGELVMKFITYFVMEYESDVPGGFGEETAEVKWVTKEEVMQLLAHKNERELLKSVESGEVA
ncbi:MAG: NUDIX hydrolase [Candidatus Amesbacteria bacterium GW2011_GWA1_46_35]|nr:MAG: NUDIX hydrolase [Candidatus Amesbacteria bacterium GW2011_GWA1_46_35]KKU68165.1 MAG: NUDIX hydrolase [Microgenomates group bacterium GW2011_GWC1_47_20]